MYFLYNLALKAYVFGIWLASFFNTKAKYWVDGRKAIFNRLQKAVEKENRPIIWMHCASLGEFEQGRPVIEGLKKEQPNYRILLTFYSPSGYEIRKNYSEADLVFYLAPDSKKNARQFLDIVQPSFAIFVKYEFWYHYLSQLKERNISTILISALFRPNQLFFKSYGGFFKSILTSFEHIFVQNQASFDLLQQHQIEHCSVAGDSRIDRVLDLAKQAKTFPIVKAFAQQAPILVGGSTWSPDEDIICPFINNTTQWKCIIAPHDIKESHLQEIESKLTVSCTRYSKANVKTIAQSKVLLIDNIGMLSSLYQYGTIAYIGGGFGAGIHNTLEPITFGLPVLFGPKYKKFEEALSLVKTGGAMCIYNKNDFRNWMDILSDKKQYDKASKTARAYVEKNQGASELILEYINKKLSC